MTRLWYVRTGTTNVYLKTTKVPRMTAQHITNYLVISVQMSNSKWQLYASKWISSALKY
jgi:hypothetical protein